LIQKSPAGSAKTIACVEFSKRNADHTQLIITPLRVLAANHYEKFQDPPFKNYLDFLGGDRKIFKDLSIPNWIVGLLSLHILPEDRFFDLIIIDECEQAFSQLLSSFQLKHPQWHETLSRLQFLMENAKQVIFMDAAITYRSIYFAQRFRPCKIRPNTPDYDQDILIRINKVKPEIRYVTQGTYNGDLKNIQKLLFEKLDAGMRIVLTSGSKTFAAETGLLAKAKGIKYAIHTRDEPNIWMIKDVNKYWGECQLVILSPNITTAVSYTGSPFHEIISLICLNSATIRDQFQMTKRVRALINQNITVFFNKKGMQNKEPENPDGTINIIPATLCSAFKKVRTTPKISVQLLEYYFEFKQAKLNQMTDKGKAAILSEDLQFFRESVNLVDLQKFEDIAAMNILEKMCDEKYFYDVYAIYARLYNWKFKGNDSYISQYPLPIIEKSVPETFDTIRTIDDKEYRLLIGKKMSGQGVNQEEANQIRKKEFLKHFKHEEQSRLLFDTKDKCMKDLVADVIEPSNVEYTEIGKRYHHLRVICSILKPSNQPNDSSVVDITKTGTIITDFNLNKLTKSDRIKYREIFSIDVDPDSGSKLDTTANSTKSGILINAILTKLFNVGLIQDTKKRRWITKTNNGFNSGIKNIMIDSVKCPF